MPADIHTTDRLAMASADTERRVAWRALDASTHGVTVVDMQAPDQPLCYVNAAFERITGYPRHEVLGRNCRLLQGSARQQPGLRHLRDALSRQVEAHVQLRNYRRDGTPFVMDLRLYPVHDEQGRLTHYVGVQHDVTDEVDRAAERLHHATRDGLTGLPNRSLLLERTRQTLALARHHARLPALLLVDLNGFREINDTLGHERGDDVLKEMARRIGRVLRAGDTLGRLSGDEFAVLLPHQVRAEDACEVAHRILERIGAPLDIDGRAVRCSGSVGVMMARDPGDDPLELVRCADIAMHAAKASGRGTVQVYSDEMAERVRDRATLRAALADAVVRGEMSLHYQPQFDLRGRRVTGVEALVRWQHPALGRVGPDRFIPIAEESGLIVPLGAWILDEACRQMRHWLDAGVIDGTVGVNVSSVQLQRGGFADLVARTLERHGLPARHLELELTESVMMDASGQTPRALADLRRLGVLLAIDDFGSGYSNLGYLKRLPARKIKIDRSFVADITDDAGSAAIVRSVIAIARHFGMQVVAEGVETQAQLAYLRDHGCDAIQGYLLGRPVPANELPALVQAAGAACPEPPVRDAGFAALQGATLPA